MERPPFHLGALALTDPSHLEALPAILPITPSPLACLMSPQNFPKSALTPEPYSAVVTTIALSGTNLISPFGP